MTTLTETIIAKSTPFISQPAILDLSNTQDKLIFAELVQSDAVQRVVDTYKAQQEELFAIKNPPLKFGPTFAQEFEAYYAKLIAEKPEEEQGCWVYFPWTKTMIHLLEEKDFHTVRTARNKPLVTTEEQEKFYNTTIAVAGLSVGSAVALSVVHQGGSRKIKIADYDTLDLSNLNRIRGDVASLGTSKVEMTARQIYELNPYAEVEVYTDGINDNTIDAFIAGANILVDEMDNFAFKFKLRERAAARKLPIVFTADLDRRSIVAIERYDLDPTMRKFDGNLGDVTLEQLESLDKHGIGRMIARLVGIDNHTPRMLDSLKVLGKEIVSWPQLGPTASMGGAIMTYCIQRIANGDPMPTMRTMIALDELLDPNYSSPEETKMRNETIDAFKKMFGL